MRKLLLFAFLFLLIGSALNSIAAEPSPAHDGSWWLKQSSSTKLDFLDGFFEGTAATRDSLLISMKLPPGATLVSAGEAFDFGGPTIGQFREGLDHLYSDYKNRSIWVSVAVHYVRDELRGKPTEFLERELRSMRAAAH